MLKHTCLSRSKIVVDFCSQLPSLKDPKPTFANGSYFQQLESLPILDFYKYTVPDGTPDCENDPAYDRDQVRATNAQSGSPTHLLLEDFPKSGGARMSPLKYLADTGRRRTSRPPRIWLICPSNCLSMSAVNQRLALHDLYIHKTNISASTRFQHSTFYRQGIK